MHTRGAVEPWGAVKEGESSERSMVDTARSAEGGDRSGRRGNGGSGGPVGEGRHQGQRRMR